MSAVAPAGAEPGAGVRRRTIPVLGAVGKGPTPVAAFDDALLVAGLGNYNLVRLSSVIPDDELSPDYVVPSVFDRSVAPAVAHAVAEAAIAAGVARTPEEVQQT